MKRTRNTAQHSFALILSLLGLVGVVTFMLDQYRSHRLIRIGSLPAASTYPGWATQPHCYPMERCWWWEAEATSPIPHAELYDPVTGAWTLRVASTCLAILHSDTAG